LRTTGAVLLAGAGKQRVLDEAQWWQDYCTNVAGMTPGKAKEKAAAAVGLSVEALNGRRRPDRMPKKQYCKQKQQGPARQQRFLGHFSKNCLMTLID
jgi:hypothetical protein